MLKRVKHYYFRVTTILMFLALVVQIELVIKCCPSFLEAFQKCLIDLKKYVEWRHAELQDKHPLEPTQGDVERPLPGTVPSGERTGDQRAM